jgi:hypothetical protein
MGIKHLNRYLVEKCKQKHIGKQSLSILSNKIIVIDTSIYMYKYHAQDALVENFYSMISLFHKYNITPLFVFDGKPPIEKYELLRQRKVDKQDAECRFNELQSKLENENDIDARKNLNAEMDTLKRQFIRISASNTKLVKRLISSYGACYYEANGEADRVCAYMVTSGKAWACMSDDMDMFVYGCDRVLRHMSLVHETVLLYNMKLILTDLNMTMTDFRQIMVVSGTDYNIDENTNLTETLRWYSEYTREKNKGWVSENITFYTWLVKQTKYIRNYDILVGIYDMFVLDNCIYPNIDQLEITLDPNYDQIQLHAVVKEDGFLFA